MLVIEEIVDRVARALDLPPHVVRERNFYRAGDVTHYGQPVRDPDRIARIWAELGASASFEARWADVGRLQRRPRPREARPGDHAGQVRHLVHHVVLQPGRRARPDLQGRQHPGESRRHRDGAGPAHEDPADRRRRPGRAPRRGAADADPHRQGPEHVGDGRLVRIGSQRRRGARRVRHAARPPRRRRRDDARGHGRRRRVRRRARRRQRPGRTRRAVLRGRGQGLLRAGAAVRDRVLQDAGDPLRLEDGRQASRSTTSPTARRSARSRSTASPGSTGCCAPTSCTTSATRSRRSSIAVRSRAASCRASAG